MTSTVTLVFSKPMYVLLASVIFFTMLFGLLVASGYVFLEPYVTGHLPYGMEFGLSLIVILSALSALVIPMNVFRTITIRSSKRKMGGSVLGSTIGAASGVCSCGPIGFAVISTFGSVGATASAFLTYYEIPIRIGAIAVLALTYYITVRSLKIECKVSQPFD